MGSMTLVQQLSQLEASRTATAWRVARQAASTGKGSAVEISAALAVLGRSVADFAGFTEAMTTARRLTETIKTLEKGEVTRQSRIGQLAAYLREHHGPADARPGPEQDALAEHARLTEVQGQLENARTSLRDLRLQWLILFGDSSNGN